MSEWDDIQAAIKEIQKQLECIEEDNKSWKRVAEEATKFQNERKKIFDADYQVLLAQYELDVAESRADQHNAQAKMRETYNSINLLKDRLNGLNKNAATYLEKQAALKGLEEAERKILEIAAESIWWRQGAE